jgi:flavin reductase (DIM6/NTAB) family NADH-FMN oxidoreductase RutF
LLVPDHTVFADILIGDLNPGRRRAFSAFFMLHHRKVGSMKVDAEYLEYMWPMRHFLITCADSKGKPNIIAVSFCMPVSKIPPLIACAIGKQAFSASLIEASGEFVVNVPSGELEKEVYFCGYHSGRDTDKFKETGLTPFPGKTVKVPSIDECIAAMECAVKDIFITGDKKLFVGEVVEAYAEEDVAKKAKKGDYAMGTFPRKVYGTRFAD